MALDPVTILAITVALAAAAALYLAVEWRSVRETSLLFWSAGFAVITLGCVLALMRSSGYLVMGIWFANGLLITAHWLFLAGVGRFTETHLSRGWYLVFALWLSMLALPDGPQWSRSMLLVQSLLIALVTLRASLLLRPHGRSLSVGAAQLRYVLLAHGIFYIAKAASALPPSALDLQAFRGQIIQISLVEGVMAIMLIALSMIGTERHRREKRIARLAARDPLTALYNRRAMEERAPRLMAQATTLQPGALLLIDIDHFKQVNDQYGHTAGDRLLITLSEIIRAEIPKGGIAARLGGDEFMLLLTDTSLAQVLNVGNALRAQFQMAAVQGFPTAHPVTLSIGVSLFEQPPVTLTALIEQGDTALYASKRDGRDSLRLSTAPASDSINVA